MIIAIVCMFKYLMKEEVVEITKDERRQKYSSWLKEGEEFRVNVASEIIGAIKNKDIWDRLFLSENFKNKFKNPQGIIPNIKEYEWFGGGDSYDFEKKCNSNFC